MNRKTKEGSLPKSVRHIRATLRAALNQAIKWDLLTRNAGVMSTLAAARSGSRTSCSVLTQLTLVESKTRGSQRTIVMPTSIGVALRLHRQGQLQERDRAGSSCT